jgi:hypothetical protein
MQTARAATDAPRVLVGKDGGAKAEAPIAITSASAFEQAKSAQATGLYQISTMRHKSGATLQVYGLLHAGQLLEVHAQKGGGWAAKQPGSRSVRTISPAQFDRLMSLAGRNLRQGSAQDKLLFTQVTGLAVDASSPGSSGAPPVRKTNCKPIDPNCNKPVSEHGVPRWLAAAVEVLIPAAHAADPSLQYFKVDVGFFSYEYDPQRGFAAFNGFGVQAIWSLP